MYHSDEPRTSLEDWESFRREASSYRFSEVLDRSELSLPDWFIPHARGAVVPSAEMLRPFPSELLAEYWHEILPGVICECRGPLRMTLIRWGALWSFLNWHPSPTALVFHCGSTPVLFRTDREAICFWWRFCTEEPESVLGYRWAALLAKQPEIGAVRTLAGYKESLEIADQLFWADYDARRRSAIAIAA